METAVDRGEFNTPQAEAAAERTPFITADWRWLVMVNYEVPPAVLEPHVPRGTELDLFEGQCLVSLVGFLFERTRVFGRLGIPLHARFEEVNLRFYVRRQLEDEIRRGVVFIKELVPSRSVTWVARTVFNENYARVPMRHCIDWHDPSDRAAGGSFRYQWQTGGRQAELSCQTHGQLAPLTPGSLPEFLVEHYFGYSVQRDGGSLEYWVTHPPWRVWNTNSCRFECDVERTYGPEFVQPLSARPHSSLVAEGSSVAVYRGVRIASGT